MSKFENVSVVKKANVYFGGKCVSHTIFLENGERKTLGLIFPTNGEILKFDTSAPEVMEINAGSCKVRLPNETEFKTYSAGESFSVPANIIFEIEIVDLLDYTCHYG